MKKKVLKILVGEAFDKETKRNFPVYASYWEQEDGSFARSQKIFVSEAEIPDKESKKPKVTL